MTKPPPLTDLGGVSVLFVMATTQEYGPDLQGVIAPLMVGVGPVEAALGTGAALARLETDGRLPDLVVSLGSAGSHTLEHAAVYQVARIAYRDMDASPLGFAKGQVPFADIPSVIEIAHRIAGLPAASLSTGGDIVSGPGYDAIDADMVDMETYAVLRAAMTFGVPLIGLRGISDGKGALAGLDDWTEVLHLIDERMAAVVHGLENDIRAGRFSLQSSPQPPT